MRCFECGAIDVYKLKDSVRCYEGEGYSFKLPVTVPYCIICGTPLEDVDLENSITKRANEMIRISKGIVLVSDIEEILTKYETTSQCLSKVLCWDEDLINNYITKGHTPNSTNSKILKSLSDPCVMKLCMKERIELDREILNDETFKKLMERVDKLLIESANMISSWFI